MLGGRRVQVKGVCDNISIHCMYGILYEQSKRNELYFLLFNLPIRRCTRYLGDFDVPVSAEGSGEGKSQGCRVG